MSVVFEEHKHGKGRVRVAKRTVDPSTGVNHFIEFTCEVIGLDEPYYSQVHHSSFFACYVAGGDLE